MTATENGLRRRLGLGLLLFYGLGNILGAGIYVLVIFSLVNLSLWRIKAREPQPAGVFCFPRWVPLLGFTASFGFPLQQLR